jgi:dihydroorotase/allantoinase
MFDLIILGATIVSPRGKVRADIGIRDGKIASIEPDLSQRPTLQSLTLDNEYVLPGAIDSHMHLWEPGFVGQPDFSSSTLTALTGGITTIVEQPLSPPATLNAQILKQKIALGEKTSYIDFALHGGVGHKNLHELEPMWKSGCTAFKIFMSDSGSEVAALNDGEMLAALQEIGRFGGTALIHAEDEAMLQENRRRLVAAGRKDPQAFLDWRPPEVELAAIKHGLYLLQETKTRAIFLHTTLPEGVKLINQARENGLDVYVETCPHNLYLTTEDFQKQGAWVSFAPPVRDPQSAATLEKQLNAGLIYTMGSDHGPVEKSLKEIGSTDIWKALFSVPDAETFVTLMLDAVAAGRLSLERLSAVQSENPARLYGLFPQKGIIQVGSDADFTVVDLRKKSTLHAANMHTACGWIPYEGRKITGKVTYTILRGQVVMQHGKILGNPGTGRFVPRGTAHSF